MKMKILLLVSLFLTLSVSVFSQVKTGTLKVFSDTQGITVFVDDVKQVNYTDIDKISVGTHYLKVLNGSGEKIYSQIVTINQDAVTTVLVEDSQPQVKPVVQSQKKPVDKPDAVSYNSTSIAEAPVVKEETTIVEPIINIGQVDGKLPSGKNGAFGLTFGMSESQVSIIMGRDMHSVDKGKSYVSYTMIDKRFNPIVPFLVECRFMDGKLFQILVGYPSMEMNQIKNKISISKNFLPLNEYNKIYAELIAQYGQPTSAERIFQGGYKDGDGRELEAIKNKKALILSSWVNPDTQNETYLVIAYSTAPLVFVVYQDGTMSRQAQQNKLVVHKYQYKNSFKENYFK